MSAIPFAVAPTVSFRPSRWICPSTEPSISRSSVPEMSPFTRRLDPSHPESWSAAAANGPIASVGLIASVLFLLHIGPSWSQHTHRGLLGGANSLPDPAYRNSLRVSAACVTRPFLDSQGL